MGGDCLNTGCVPSKALIRSARMLSYFRRAEEFGIRRAEADFDFAEVMERVQRVIGKVEPHDSVERYTSLGVEVMRGEAKITSPWTVEVDGRTLTTRAIVIATGASPLVPPIKGLDQIDYLTSDNLWALRELPQRLVVLGGGPIGCEMTQAFARFGAQVTQVEMGPRIMPREDEDVSEFVRRRFEAEGVRVLTGHAAREVRVAEERKVLICEHAGQPVEIEFDAMLVAVGRQANVKGFGLEELGVRLDPRGTIETDPFLRTNFPNIFCAGDVAGPYQFTHTAAHQAWYAAVNALFGQLRKFRVDYRVIPWTTFTDPEVARVGLSEAEAKEQKIDYEVARFELAELDRAIAEGEEHGWVKVLTPPGKDKILGATIVGSSCRRPAGRVRPGDEARPRPEQDPRHHPRLPDAGRGEQDGGRRLEEAARAGEAPRLGGALSWMAAGIKGKIGAEGDTELLGAPDFVFEREMKPMVEAFKERLKRVSPHYIRFETLQTLQVNLGDQCNMRCAHCHVGASPAGQKVMGRPVIDKVAAVLQGMPGTTLDITGGCPEINPHFRHLIEATAMHSPRRIVRSNLTILTEPGFEWLPEFFRDQRLVVTASLPCYLEENVDRQRGQGTHARSLAALRRLNEVGYGDELELNLVYNPGGDFIPGSQDELERAYRKEMADKYGIRFHHLFTITNAPIGRFREHLEAKGIYDRYLNLLATRFNAGAARTSCAAP